MKETKKTVLVNIKNFNTIKLSDLKSSVTHFDLFLDIAGRAVLYAPSPYRWTVAEKYRLINDGHVVLFYDPSQSMAVNDYLVTNSSENLAIEPLADSTVMLPLSDLAAEFSQLLYRLSLGLDELARVKSLTHSLVHAVLGLPESLYYIGNLASHDTFSFYHSARVAAYAAALAQKMGCTDEDKLSDIALGCILHDLGHLRIDAKILEKKGTFNEREWNVIYKHPEWGCEMAESFKLNPVANEIILHHHEREDGKGYPHGIKGAELPKEVRIVTVCDTFDALTSRRPYQKAQSPEQAVAFMEQVAKDFLDQDVLTALKELVENTTASLSQSA